MINQGRCKNCGRPINEDQQQNFFSFCYDCFRDYKSSNLRRASAMRIIGIIGLFFVSFYIFMFSRLSGFYRPLGMVAFIIASIIAILVPLLLVVFGTKKKIKWNRIFKAQPIIEPQQIITPPPASPMLVQKKFCPECGSEIGDINQRFCVNCGTELLI